MAYERGGCAVRLQVTCKLFYFVQNFAYSCSVLILTLISLERYIAIRHPMLNRRFGATRAVHGVVIGSAWLLSAVYSLPWLVAYDIVSTGPDAVFCFNTLPLNTRIYAMINFYCSVAGSVLSISSRRLTRYDVVSSM